MVKRTEASAYDSALKAIKGGFERVAEAADRISNPESGINVEDAVQISIGKNEVKAGVKIAQVASEMDQEILKII